ncbi:MAG: NlpC/P60 family protein [Candidatus Acidiferrales bacterium]
MGINLIESQRRAVVEEAKSWLGTPYRLNGEEKYSGVDCQRLIVACYRAAGVPMDLELPSYSSWSDALAAHRRDKGGLARLREFMNEIEIPNPGDVALATLHGVYIHAAIVIRWPQVLHTMRVVSISSFKMRDKVKFLSPKSWR